MYTNTLTILQKLIHCLCIIVHSCNAAARFKKNNNNSHSLHLDQAQHRRIKHAGNRLFTCVCKKPIWQRENLHSWLFFGCYDLVGKWNEFNHLYSPPARQSVIEYCLTIVLSKNTKCAGEYLLIVHRCIKTHTHICIFISISITIVIKCCKSYFSIFQICTIQATQQPIQIPYTLFFGFGV